jgi:hypothetical protein
MEPGYEFAPADHDLTDDYLAVEIAGHPVVSSFIHHGDVYSAVPDVIASGRQLVRDRDHNDACYIISPVRFASVKKRNRKLRMIDDDPRKSFWHSEKGKIPLEGSKSGGYVQDFVQAIKGTDGHTERLGWRMKETRVRPLDGAARRQRPRSFSARSTACLETHRRLRHQPRRPLGRLRTCLSTRMILPSTPRRGSPRTVTAQMILGLAHGRG